LPHVVAAAGSNLVYRQRPLLPVAASASKTPQLRSLVSKAVRPYGHVFVRSVASVASHMSLLLIANIIQIR